MRGACGVMIAGAVHLAGCGGPSDNASATTPARLVPMPHAAEAESLSRERTATRDSVSGGASGAPSTLAWPDLATPPVTSTDGANDAALLIGVEDYLFVPKVPGAAKNVTDWFTYLVDGRKVPIAQVKLLRNADATKEGILARAGEVASVVKPGGTVWIVFIGHGAPAQDQKEGVLVGVDAQQTAESLYARSVRQSELQAALGPRQAVMVLDACFSGRAGNGEAIASGLQPLLPVRAATDASMTLLTAGKGNQFAGPLPGLGRPAFSYLVLGAMRGWGDANGDGTVTAQEAVDYAQKALTVLPLGRVQTPERIGGDGSLALSHNAKEAGPNLSAMVAGSAGRGGGTDAATIEARTRGRWRLVRLDDAGRRKLEQNVRAAVHGEAAAATVVKLYMLNPGRLTIDVTESAVTTFDNGKPVSRQHFQTIKIVDANSMVVRGVGNDELSGEARDGEVDVVTLKGDDIVEVNVSNGGTWTYQRIR